VLSVGDFQLIDFPLNPLPAMSEAHPMFYLSLPVFCCGTIGFDHRSEYVVDTLIENGHMKAYKLMLIFYSDQGIDFFKRCLFAELRHKGWLTDSDIQAMRKRYIEYGDDNHVRQSKIYTLSRNSGDKFPLKDRFRGLSKDFMIVQMDK